MPARLPLSRFYLCTLGLLLFLQAVQKRAHGQPALGLAFTALSPDDGLSRGYVTALLQDADGFLWVGTSDGLNRYDGYAFRVYRHRTDDNTSLSGNDISALFEDAQHRLWISTRDHGLELYDRRKARFIHFSMGGPRTILSNTVGQVAQDRSGTICVVTAGGVNCIAPFDAAAGSPDQGPQPSISTVSLPPGFIADPDDLRQLELYTGRDGGLRIVGRKVIGRVERSGVLHGKAHLVIEHEYSNIPGFGGIDRMRYDPLDDALILFVGDSIVRCPATPGVNTLQFLATASRQSEHFHLDEAAHNLWYVSNHQVFRMNLRSGVVRHIEAAEPDAREALFSSLLFYTDRGRNLWIGSSGYGLLKYSPVQQAFQTALPECNAYGISADGNGFCVNATHRVSIGPDGDALADSVLTGRAYEAVLGGARLKFSVRLPDSTHCFQTPGGLALYHPRTRRTERVLFERRDELPLPSPLYYDARTRTVWSGYEDALLKFDVDHRSFQRFRFPLPPRVSLLQFVHCITGDAAGRLWIGTRDGLLFFDPKISRWIVYRSNIDPADFSSAEVYALCHDPRDPHTLWVGRSGAGLQRLDKETGQFSTHPFSRVLHDGVVYGILPDPARGELWMSTNSGLYCLNPATGRYRNYTKADGLQGAEFNRYAAYKTPSGIMVFGGLHGVNYFDPAEVRPLSPPPVFLTALRLFNRAVDHNAPGARLHEDIGYARNLTLAHDQSMITLVFAAPDYRHPGDLSYRYKLAGFDEDWVEAGAAHEATYTNLDPGAYSFTAQARYANGEWGPPSAPLRIRITPPWWMRWWAVLLFAAALGGIVYAIVRFRRAQIRRVEGVRTAIARDLHDDIGSMLSTIAIYARVAQQQAEESSVSPAPALRKITENAGKVMEAMADIIWSINIREEDTASLPSRMRAHAAEVFDEARVALHLDFDENPGGAGLSVEKWKDLYLLYKEALNNVAKYADARNVWVTFRTGHGLVLLTIRDDGRGFDPETVRRGNGLKNMATRAAAMGGTLDVRTWVGGGTVVELRV